MKKVCLLRITTLLLLCLGQVSYADRGAATGATAATPSTTPDNQHLVVHKSPSCGCCLSWIEHMRTNGFSAAANHPERFAALKRDKGIAPRYQSCHTAVSQQGYVFEGHVPAKFVRQFLANPPAGTIGLSVPGMPLGSPGMQVDDRFMPYQVLLLTTDGKHQIYAQVTRASEQF